MIFYRLYCSTVWKNGSHYRQDVIEYFSRSIRALEKLEKAFANIYESVSIERIDTEYCPRYEGCVNYRKMVDSLPKDNGKLIGAHEECAEATIVEFCSSVGEPV